MLDVPTSCVGCGACCEFGLCGQVPGNRGDLPEWYRAEHDRTPLVKGAACPWFRQGRCLHYDDRPPECRSKRWEPGTAHCLEILADRAKTQARVQTH